MSPSAPSPTAVGSVLPRVPHLLAALGLARVPVALLLLTLLLPAPVTSQYYQTDFDAEEFRGRWAQVYDAIGSDAVAVLQGFPVQDGYIYPRQYNNFYYLSGIERPGAYLLLDGRTRTTTLYLPPRSESLDRAEGPEMGAEHGELLRELMGVDRVTSTEVLADLTWPVNPAFATSPGVAAATAIYAEFAEPELAGQTRGLLRTAAGARAADPWDGQITRQQQFVEHLRDRNPGAEVRDLNPILDRLRSIKSPAEVALIRRACQLTGLGLMEAMKSTAPGVYEYQLDAAARYVFLVNGARLEGYRSITAAGTENIGRLHYFRNIGPLRDGDLVLMDYAPDYRNYTCDVGRVWPVNGSYQYETQRELLQVILEFHKAVLERIRPGVTSDEILREAQIAMEPVFARTQFSKPIYEAAARRMVETGGGVFSHTVGMAVHDVGRYRGAPLQPGQVFSVDPQLRVPEEGLYLRYEDTVVVTETGVENFTDFMPMELADMERLVREAGIVQLVPPVAGR